MITKAKQELPSFRTYGDYSSEGYGVHTLQFLVGDLTVWFSYQTPVAFCHGIGQQIVRQNDWGPTTGKHLNWIDGGDKASRVDSGTFERLLAEALA